MFAEAKYATAWIYDIKDICGGTNEKLATILRTRSLIPNTAAKWV